MHPDAELELQPAGNSLLADIPEHFEIAIALGVRQLRDAHIVARHSEQER